MDIRLLMFLWGCGIAAGSALLAFSWSGPARGERGSRRHRWAWCSTAIALGLSAVALACLARMYFGGGHPTAQMTGSMELWSWWVHTYWLLILGKFIGGLLILASFFYWWKPASHKKLFLARVTGAATVVFGFYLLAPLFPDA